MSSIHSSAEAKEHSPAPFLPKEGEVTIHRIYRGEKWANTQALLLGSVWTVQKFTACWVSSPRIRRSWNQAPSKQAFCTEEHMSWGGNTRCGGRERQEKKKILNICHSSKKDSASDPKEQNLKQKNAQRIWMVYRKALKKTPVLAMDTAMVPEFHQTLSGKGPQQGFLQRRHTGGQLVCGRCWTPLIIRKIQVTTTMRSGQAGNLSALPPHFSPGLRSVSID
ncbi:uncharacterized protein LOC129625372 [Bubalus kerabau]|uniref:uncharacterized protein LOC129625372 n=1 Tax=Bubalus carabanensis TaxID=3119969 RepID=UPI00244EBA8E|nr:uncharacterized protein LOC129625372 [Bubalus carabanensis]